MNTDLAEGVSHRVFQTEDRQMQSQGGRRAGCRNRKWREKGKAWRPAHTGLREQVPTGLRGHCQDRGTGHT